MRTHPHGEGPMATLLRRSIRSSKVPQAASSLRPGHRSRRQNSRSSERPARTRLCRPSPVGHPALVVTPSKPSKTISGWCPSPGKRCMKELILPPPSYRRRASSRMTILSPSTAVRSQAKVSRIGWCTDLCRRRPRGGTRSSGVHLSRWAAMRRSKMHTCGSVAAVVRPWRADL